MKSRDRQVFTEFSEDLRRRFPDAEIWAFGSRARGEATAESDLDVCVVLPDLDDAADEAVLQTAWAVGFRHDVVISTVTFSKAEFREGPCRESALVKSILTTGLAA